MISFDSIQILIRIRISSSLHERLNFMNDSDPKPPTSTTSKALVFVSHDTRDAEIAEAFSRLLSSVSAGVLKSFRSSDKKGNQGIEYGVDWYPEIMGKLKVASDVVCLLTPFSINRPWILYEAGVAKGHLDTPVHGLAVGIPLGKASTGPFAQFQNCDDTVESITSLVIQLVSRIPNAEPDRDVVVAQVSSFRQRCEESLRKQGHEESPVSELDSSSVAKLFEEIKVMYQDLPGRIESRIGDGARPIRNRLRIHPKMLLEMMFSERGGPTAFLPLVQSASVYREELPWLYDLSYELFIADESGDHRQVQKLLRALSAALQAQRRNPIFEDLLMSKDINTFLRELPELLDYIAIMSNERNASLNRLEKEELNGGSEPRKA
jgi:hypothetical protein